MIYKAVTLETLNPIYMLMWLSLMSFEISSQLEEFLARSVARYFRRFLYFWTGRKLYLLICNKASFGNWFLPICSVSQKQLHLVEATFPNKLKKALNKLSHNKSINFAERHF